MCIVRLVSVLNLFFICILVKHENSAYFVQYFQHRDTWFDAQTFCNLKGGRLANNEDRLNCNQLLGPIDSSQGSTYWTGKYKTISHWISKIGCLKILGKPDVVQSHSVSSCFEECRKQHIKIKLLAHKRSKCVCISENIRSLEKIVGINNCSHSLDSDNNYWAYTVTQNTTLDGPGKCAFVDCRHKPEVNTDNCETKRTPFCDNSQRLNWSMSQEICKYQTTPEDLWDICRTLPDKHLNAWLPMHRVVFWTEVTCDGIATDEAVTECESFRCFYNDEVRSFRVKIACSNKTDGFFCVFSSPYNMTTTKIKTVADSAVLCPGTFSFKSTNYHGSNERTVNIEQITGKRSFLTSINSISMLQSTTSIIAKQDDNRNIAEISEHHATSNIGLIVGGVLGALAIFGVVILVVILTLRRRKASTKNQSVEQIEISYEDQQRKTVSNNTRVNQLYEDEGVHAGRPVPVRTKETECANEQEGKKSNDVYAVVMKNNMTTPLQVGINSVVASEDAAESEYDRLNITPKVLTDNMEYNLYDSSIADRCESDPTYNTATNIRHSRKNTEDVYD